MEETNGGKPATKGDIAQLCAELRAMTSRIDNAETWLKLRDLQIKTEARQQLSATERLERFTEIVAKDREEFRIEHKQLLTAQVLTADALTTLAVETKEARHRDERGHRSQPPER